MLPSENCVALVKQFEGCSLKCYKCPAGVLTIGYGKTSGVHEGDRCTEEQATAWLMDDLQRFGRGVERLVHVPLNQNQFDALVCFAYNVGLGALENSTLLRKLNDGNYAGAAAQFHVWNKAGGVTLEGLTKRRNAEMDLFNA